MLPTALSTVPDHYIPMNTSQYRTLPGSFLAVVRAGHVQSAAYTAARWLLMICALFLSLLGALKLASSPHAKGMHDPDPLFYFVETGSVLYAIGAVEVCLGLVLLLQRAKYVATAKLFLALTVAVSLYRVGLTALAPGSSCHCGGFGRIGLKLVATLPSYALTTLLGASCLSSLSLIVLAPGATRNVRLRARTAAVARLALLPLLCWHNSLLTLVAAALPPAPALGATDGWYAYGTGVLQIVVYNTNGLPLGDPVQYALAACLRDKGLTMTNSFPDGTGQWSLMRSNIVLQVAVSKNLSRRGSRSGAGSTTLADQRPSPGAATVFTTEYSHAGLTPDAFVWLAHFGGAHVQAGSYLKPPHFHWDEVAAWLTAVTFSNLPSRQGPLLQAATWRISLGAADFARAASVLPRDNEIARAELQRAQRPFPQYPANVMCGSYLLLETNVIDGVVLPSKCEARGFVPVFERGKPVTNRLSSLRTLELDWSREGGLGIAEDMELASAIWFQDFRAASPANNGRPVFYQSKQLAVIPTNSPIYREALQQQLARVSSPSKRLILRTVMIGLIAAVLVAGLWSLRRSGGRSKKAFIRGSN